jgi:hypothetical protein
MDVVFGGDAHANAFSGWFAVRTHQNDAVMASFFDTAKIGDVGILVTNYKTKDFGVEPEAFGKIFDKVAHMTRARNIERG